MEEKERAERKKKSDARRAETRLQLRELVKKGRVEEGRAKDRHRAEEAEVEKKASAVSSKCTLHFASAWRGGPAGLALVLLGDSDGRPVLWEWSDAEDLYYHMQTIPSYAALMAGLRQMVRACADPRRPPDLRHVKSLEILGDDGNVISHCTGRTNTGPNFAGLRDDVMRLVGELSEKLPGCTVSFAGQVSRGENAAVELAEKAIPDTYGGPNAATPDAGRSPDASQDPPTPEAKPESRRSPQGYDPRTDSKLRKWWKRRYELFSRYDEGCVLDREAWFEVTPEAVADSIARRVAEKKGGRPWIVLDPFAGVGGNSIAFARAGASFVIASDINAERIRMLETNARVYGLQKVVTKVMDCHHFMSLLREADISLTADAHDRREWAVFLSPPWGDAYQARDNGSPFFDIDALGGGLRMSRLVRLALDMSSLVAAYLPKTSSKKQLEDLAAELGCGLSIEVVGTQWTKKCAWVAYFERERPPTPVLSEEFERIDVDEE